MTVDVSHIRDPKVRAYCAHMEHLCQKWHDGVRYCNDTIQVFIMRLRDDLIPLSSLGFQDRQLKTIDALHLLKHELDAMRSTDARIRGDGFDARRAGQPVTANPHVEIIELPDAGSVVPNYMFNISKRAAIPWYIGWKQGARIGEPHLPE